MLAAMLLAVTVTGACGDPSNGSSAGGVKGGKDGKDGKDGKGGPGESDALICAYYRQETVVCPNPPRTERHSEGFCMAAAPGDDCQDVLPPDEDWKTRPDGCEVEARYRISSVHTLFEPEPGTCERWRKWYDADIECFNDGNCGDNETCQDDACHCGATAFPFDDRATATRCSGDDIVFDLTQCAANHTLVTTTMVSARCEPSTGARCVTGSDGIPFCQGSPPPPPPR